MNIAIILGIWGSLLSTILACVKLWEVWKDRPRLSVSFSINPNSPDQNVVSVTNLSKNTITIVGFKLFWAKNINDIKLYRDIRTRFDQDCYIEILPYKTTRITFEEEDYFSIRSDKGKLYVQIFIAGHNTEKVKLLYEP